MNKLEANLALFSVTICWSVQIIFMKNVPDTVPHFAFLALTSAVGIFVLALTYWGELKNITLTLFGKGFYLAALMTLTNILMLTGVRDVSDQASAFGSSFYVVIVPVLMLIIFKARLSALTVISILLLFGGLLLGIGLSFHTGMMFLLAGSFVFSLYILLLDHYAKNSAPGLLAVTQIFFSAVFAAAGWLITDPGSFVTIEYSGAFISSVFVVAVFIRAYSTVMQVYAQRYVTPINATMVYSTEIIFTLLLLMVVPPLLGSEAQFPGWMEITGGALLVFGIILSNFNTSFFKGFFIRSKIDGKPEEALPEDTLPATAVPEEEPALQSEKQPRRPFKRTLTVFSASLIMYTALEVCFRAMFTEFPGPAVILPACLGLAFGLPAAFGSAAGALLSCLLEQTFSAATLASALVCVVSALGIHYGWYLIHRAPPKFKTVTAIFRFCLYTAGLAVISAGIATAAGDAAFLISAVMYFLWPVVFGLPVLIVMSSMLNVSFTVPDGVHIPPEPNLFSRRILNTVEEVSNVCEELPEYCEAEGIEMGKAFQINLAVEEMLFNIIDNAYPDGRESHIDLSVRPGEVIRIRIADDGAPFNPLNFNKQKLGFKQVLKQFSPIAGPDPDALGIILVSKMAVRAQYKRVGDINTLEILL
jgi:drug/metabolite transporter (DMT)-like permease/anti-sigma regulatory factor (Ser/Thr protein kinase)